MRPWPCPGTLCSQGLSLGREPRARTGLPAAQGAPEENSELNPLPSAQPPPWSPKICAGRKGSLAPAAPVELSSFGKQKLPVRAPAAALCPSGKGVGPGFICSQMQSRATRCGNTHLQGCRQGKDRDSAKGDSQDSEDSDILPSCSHVGPSCPPADHSHSARAGTTPRGSQACTGPGAELCYLELPPSRD